MSIIKQGSLRSRVNVVGQIEQLLEDQAKKLSLDESVEHPELVEELVERINDDDEEINDDDEVTLEAEEEIDDNETKVGEPPAKAAMKVGEPLAIDTVKMKQIHQITSAVRATNPILDQLIHSLELIKANDPTLTELNLKECNCFNDSHASQLALALVDNIHVKSLDLGFTRLSNASAKALASALESNDSIEFLNLEGNIIGPHGMRAIAYMLAENRSLIELKLGHQSGSTPTGTDAEQIFANSLAKNQVLQKLSLILRDVSSRDTVNRSLARNKESYRKSKFSS